MAVTLLRHTRPDIASGLCYGMSDIPLAATFKREADALFDGLPPAGLVVTSPLSRCRQLADYVAARKNLAVKLDTRLQEMDFGHWEGLPWDDIPRAEIDAWAKDFLHARPHGGESVAMFRARTLNALAEYRKLEGHTLIVTHAGVIKAALASDESADSHAATLDFGNFVTLTD